MGHQIPNDHLNREFRPWPTNMLTSSIIAAPHVRQRGNNRSLRISGGGQPVPSFPVHPLPSPDRSWQYRGATAWRAGGGAGDLILLPGSGARGRPRAGRACPAGWGRHRPRLHRQASAAQGASLPLACRPPARRLPCLPFRLSPPRHERKGRHFLPPGCQPCWHQFERRPRQVSARPSATSWLPSERPLRVTTARRRP